jgi:hypothetical protein
MARTDVSLGLGKRPCNCHLFFYEMLQSEQIKIARFAGE